MEKEKLQPITIETTVAALIEKVWAYWSEPRHIMKWNYASPDWHAPSADNDLRVGGKFTSRMEAKDGSFGFDFSGVYTEVKPQRLIAYTLEDGRNVKITFEQIGSETKITEVFDPENENPIDMQTFGWQAILDNFKKYTENN